ncbi:MAG: trimethyllysine dioxygenase [Ilumatobacteraceae bacterium]|nr:trimethyllysine dioxygenase [Ilumatobacteraceae bacterium]
MPTISALAPHDGHLSVTWSDGADSSYPWIWLRDHAHDEATLHPVTQQRQLYTASVTPTLSAQRVAVVEHDVKIEWLSDDQPSVLPIEFLERFRRPSAATAGIDQPRVLWDARSVLPPPTVAYDDVMSSDEGVAEWLRKVAAYGFAIATGTPADSEATEALARRVGYVRETIFGGFWEFSADLSKADTAYTNLELRPHTDGTYSHDAPGLQMLHCLQFDGEGGASTMVDGFRIAAELSQKAPQLYEVLAKVDIPGQYIGDGSHLMAARPALRHDHTGALVQVSFNNADRAPFLLPPDEMVSLYDAIRAFDLLANEARLQWRHVLAPGEALLFDNWRVLHGRHAYTGLRRMCGAYINHEDFESRLRTASIAR